MFDTTLHRLRVFKVVVDAGGMSTAAVELGITQPAVSAHVRALEALVGQPLFVRHPRQHVALTEAGRVLYDYAHDAILGANSVIAVLDEIKQGLRGRINIAMTRTLGHSVLAPVLATYHQEVPDTLVTVRSGQLSEVTQLVASGAVSFAVVVSLSPIARLETEFVRPEPSCIVASPNHRLACRNDVSARELATEGFIVGMRDSWNFHAGLAMLRDVGFSYERIVFETDDYVTVERLVEENCGVALLLRESVERDIAAGRLVVLKTNFKLPMFQLGIARLATHRFTPCELRLVTLIREILAEPMEGQDLDSSIDAL